MTAHGPMLGPATPETVRAMAPGAEWQAMWHRPRLVSPDAAFVGRVKVNTLTKRRGWFAGQECRVR
jgi:hypothetical protein